VRRERKERKVKRGNAAWIAPNPILASTFIPVVELGIRSSTWGEEEGVPAQVHAHNGS
jgi:hypothetical protein